MIYSIHILRGLCAWMVVVHHFCYSYFDGISNPLPDSIQTLSFILGIGVDVFFVISGYVMSLLLEKHSQSPIPASQFLKRRLLRIIPGWWFYLGLFALLSLTIEGLPYTIEWSWQTLLQSALLLPHSNLNGSGFYPILYVGWSLTFELFFYGLIFLFIALSIKHLPFMIAMVLFSLAIIFPDQATLGHANFFFMEFLMGFVFRRKSEFVGALFLWSAFSIWVLYGQFEAARFTLASTIFVLAMNANITRESLLNRWLGSSGNYSYSIYLSHLIAIGLVHIALPPSEHTFKNIAAFCAVLLMTYLMSKLSFRWVEQSFQKWG
ncbi:acyltransferase family protein [Marinomonas ostreistagni]|uniref:Acyltransferase n=1 Tax=Marinomonas ostreistagni TaxID=359209 RepID=A0ABS0ZCX6_9GAMM|nr:acyltransferase [Marinomonas ostreistagni]MBJ7551489.1 acyltransferase [Marinomonas ostreistagni]